MRYLSNTCTNDMNEVAGVCGECGELLCDDCATSFEDPTFRTFGPGGLTSILVGLGLLAVPILISQTEIVSIVSETIWGGTVFLRKGLVQSSVILGVAMLLGTWFRTGEKFEIVDGDANERLLCSECYSERRQMKILYLAIVAASVLVMIYGVYTVATDGRNPTGGPFFWELRIVALGGALYLLRNDITMVVAQLRS